MNVSRVYGILGYDALCGRDVPISVIVKITAQCVRFHVPEYRELLYLSHDPKVTSCGQGKERYGSIKDETFLISKAKARFELEVNPKPNIKYHYLIINYVQSICVLQ